MKRKLAERTEPKKTRKKGKVLTVQTAGSILIINLFEDKELKARYCMDSEVYQYETYQAGVWIQRKFSAFYRETAYSYWDGFMNEKEVRFDSEDDRKTIEKILKKENWREDMIRLINDREEEYVSENRKKKEFRRQKRVKDVMSQVPDMPEDIRKWISKRAVPEDYFFFDSEKKEWRCTGCRKSIPENRLKRENGEKPKDKDRLTCPHCKKVCCTVRRGKRKVIKTNFIVMQPIDEESGVMRMYDAEIVCDKDGKSVKLSEAIRIILFKSLSKRYFEKTDIYYNQNPKTWEMENAWRGECGAFDNRGNISNRRFNPGYLYRGGIEQALEGTALQRWIRVFAQMAEAGIYADYNALMTSNEESMTELTEMLFKGRFYRLLLEESGRISFISREYTGTLVLDSSRIENIFRIEDRQKINRIREQDGGSLMVEWMRWSERRNMRLSDRVLKWLDENGCSPKDMQWLLIRMSPEKAMNYIERQRNESYSGKSVKGVISQYEDYMQMCQRLKKDTADEMVYRPRELKRRHDEAVKEIEEQKAEITADEYSARFPGVEDVMEEIRGKYEYSSEKYSITVPRRCVDIVLEGRALHHCAGATDRYFDRIKQHETYICFLRRTAEPDKPYYTIEVEPGGTIRQHRGYMDEEPEIEEVRPFLREWQQVIRRRMSEEDRERARISAVKRQENIEELKAKKNTRVLEGLMEDFMEAI